MAQTQTSGFKIQGIRFAKNRRTKQEQRPSEGAARAVSSSLEYCRVASEFEELKSLGLCLARRRKTEGQISQNLNENLTEHEVVTETLIVNDTLKIERISDRQRTLVSGSQMQDTKVVVRKETVRATVYIAHRDSSLQVLGRAKRQSRATAYGLQEDGTPTISGKQDSEMDILDHHRPYRPDCNGKGLLTQEVASTGCTSAMSELAAFGLHSTCLPEEVSGP